MRKRLGVGNYQYEVVENWQRDEALGAARAAYYGVCKGRRCG